MAKVYLAMYKHKRDWRKEPVKAIADRITRFCTKGKYSHCEIAIERIEFGNGHHYEHATVYDCYSSSYKMAAYVANRLMCPITPNGM